MFTWDRWHTCIRQNLLHNLIVPSKIVSSPDYMIKLSVTMLVFQFSLGIMEKISVCST